jgi:hypothetical protein
VEDALQAVGQMFAQLGGPDIRKDFSSENDFQIRWQIRAYKKEESPPSRVNPVSILVIVYILNLAHGLF